MENLQKMHYKIKLESSLADRFRTTTKEKYIVTGGKPENWDIKQF